MGAGVAVDGSFSKGHIVDVVFSTLFSKVVLSG